MSSYVIDVVYIAAFTGIILQSAIITQIIYNLSGNRILQAASALYTNNI